LHHSPQRAPAQANRRLRSCEPFIANYAGFRGSSIFHDDDKRNQTSTKEISKFQLSTRLVKDEMVGQEDVFEMRAKYVVVAIGDRQEKFVADWLSGGIRSLAGLHGLEVLACHEREPKNLPDAGMKLTRRGV
jgi:hypothetical protein